jgi:hypothetical protein
VDRKPRFAAVADAMHSTDELLAGLHHPEAEVRWRVVDRLVHEPATTSEQCPS